MSESDAFGVFFEYRSVLVFLIAALTLATLSFVSGWISAGLRVHILSAAFTAPFLNLLLVPMIFFELRGLTTGWNFGASIGYLFLLVIGLVMKPWLLSLAIVVSSGMSMFAYHLRHEVLARDMKNRDVK